MLADRVLGNAQSDGRELRREIQTRHEEDDGERYEQRKVRLEWRGSRLACRSAMIQVGTCIARVGFHATVWD